MIRSFKDSGDDLERSIMKSSGIGGQAVMEGVMMQHNEKYAIAVRRANNEIDVSLHDCNRSAFIKKIRKIPLIRGAFSFVDSMVIGMKTLMHSANILIQDEELKVENEEGADNKKSENKKDEGKSHGVLLGFTVFIAICFSVALFFVLPWLATEGLRLLFPNIREFFVVLVEGSIRISIFLVYLILVSKMEDIQRVFRYHGAEHKCINCIETGKELNVENVRESSRLHKRCGTSFLFVVMIVSLFLFMIIRIPHPIARLGIRLLMLPVVAGISYEFIKLAGRSENKCVMALSKPGMMLQKVTTGEPDDSMIEVAIASVEAVFDWRNYLRENGIEVSENEE